MTGLDGFVNIKNLTKSYAEGRRRTEVLKGVSLSVGEGDFFGIIGLSGAGKSTLARCVNGLETPDSGEITVGGVALAGKKPAQAAKAGVGMIFQSFNLFESKTVFRNIEYPLAVQGMPRREREGRVLEMARVTGVADKLGAYPGGLSGGQKQRVGIARALAVSPRLLISDEATSSLDPQATMSILELLMEINRTTGLTVMIITHELDVVRYATRNMAVLEDGVISETGPTRDIFANPNSTTGRMFLKVYSELREKYEEGGSGI